MEKRGGGGWRRGKETEIHKIRVCKQNYLVVESVFQTSLGELSATLYIFVQPDSCEAHVHSPVANNSLCPDNIFSRARLQHASATHGFCSGGGGDPACCLSGRSTSNSKQKQYMHPGAEAFKGTEVFPWETGTSVARGPLSTCLHLST